MTHSTELSSEALDWLVTSRNKIQSLLLRLHRAHDDIPAAEWQFWLGAAFSLWRAVFLCHSEDVEKDELLRDEHARALLMKVIETNAIGFGDDRSARLWSGGYYVNNALFRLDLRQPAPSGRRSERLRDLWDEAFTKLDALIP